MKKRVLSVLLAVVIIAGLLPTAAFAAEEGYNLLPVISVGEPKDGKVQVTITVQESPQPENIRIEYYVRNPDGTSSPYAPYSEPFTVDVGSTIYAMAYCRSSSYYYSSVDKLVIYQGAGLPKAPKPDISLFGWSTDQPGVFTLTEKTTPAYTYYFYLCKNVDGANILLYRCSDAVLSFSDDGSIVFNADFADIIQQEGTGRYFVAVTAYMYDGFVAKETEGTSDAVFSEVFEYTKPTEKVAVPTLNDWDNINGSISWTVADTEKENVDGYELSVFYSDTKSLVEDYGWTPYSPSCIKSSSFVPTIAGFYKIQVRAKSKDITKNLDSDPSNISDVFECTADRDLYIAPNITADGTTVTLSFSGDVPIEMGIEYSLSTPEKPGYINWERYDKPFTVETGTDVCARSVGDFATFTRRHWDGILQTVDYEPNGYVNYTTELLDVGLPKLDAPTDLGWGRDIEYDWNEQTGKMEYQLGNDLPGAIYWKSDANNTDSSFEVNLYKKLEGNGTYELVYPSLRPFLVISVLTQMLVVHILELKICFIFMNFRMAHTLLA